MGMWEPEYGKGWVPCDCQKIRASERRIERSGLAKEIQEKTFKNFRVDTEWQRNLKDTAIAYGEAYFEAKKTGGKIPWLFVSGEPGCVDADTEYFNGREWKRISEYDGGAVLQYDPETKQATITQPTKYIKKDADVLYEIKKKRGGINQVLSHDHNFAYVTSKGNMQKKPFHEVMRLHNSSVQGFCGRVETAFKYGGHGITLNEKEIRIMCAVIADGSFRKGLRQCSINVKKERKKKRLRELLKGMDYHEYTKSNGYSCFRFYAPKREKVFSDYWYSCDNEQLKIIVDEVFNWDGSINGKRRTFTSTEKKNADFIQFALASCGIRATIWEDKRKDKKTAYEVIASSGGSLVSLRHTGGKNKAEISTFIPKDGKQYCFTVETGYLVLRRGGRIFITGNSGKTHICTALCGAFLKREVSVVYMQWVTDSRRLRALVNDVDAFEEEIQPFLETDVLYIDDLFKQPSHSELRATDAEGKVVFELLNRRMMLNKATIISTEWYLEDELMAFDAGTFSRAYMLAKGFTVNIERGMDKNYRLKGFGEKRMKEGE